MNLFAQADQWLLDPKIFCLFDFAELSALISASVSALKTGKKLVPGQIYMFIPLLFHHYGCMITTYKG